MTDAQHDRIPRTEYDVHEHLIGPGAQRAPVYSVNVQSELLALRRNITLIMINCAIIRGDKSSVKLLESSRSLSDMIIVKQSSK